jgi:NAD(P)-dependent dehydrogenase (short-subunit alcohol dehydrogenase family)
LLEHTVDHWSGGDVEEDKDAVLRMFDYARREFGTIDILVANAGLQQDARHQGVYVILASSQQWAGREVPLNSRACLPFHHFPA